MILVGSASAGSTDRKGSRRAGCCSLSLLPLRRHCRTECDPSNYDKVHRKKRCPAPGCREKLTTINSYTCKVVKDLVARLVLQ